MFRAMVRALFRGMLDQGAPDAYATQSSGKSAAGSLGVPFHRLAKPRGTKPARHAHFLLEKPAVVHDLGAEDVAPDRIPSFVHPEDPPREQVNYL